MKPVSRVLLIIAAVCLAANMILPIWQIELYAPQYPEGLELKIYADKLAGNVEIINGLNHYIGMKTLHTEDFIEFSILRYIFAFVAVCILLVAIIGRKKPVYYLFAGFVIFAVISMADFYRWNYNYGHDLDPNAAIKVPGMAYQPPLLGYKQLLNFGAYSIPDIGGWLFIAAGVLLLSVVLIETRAIQRWFKRRNQPATVLLMICLLPFMACSQGGPIPVQVNKDGCAYCKMTITDARFSTQLITSKGRRYFFDDITCMADYQRENNDAKDSRFYVSDYTSPNSYIGVEESLLLHSDGFRSPMGGNIAAFATQDSLAKYQLLYQASLIDWNTIVSRN